MIDIRVHWTPFSGAYEFYVAERGIDGKPTHLGKMVMEPYEQGLMAQPTFQLFDGVAVKGLATQLKSLGLVGDESAGELKATKFHLEDMRKIARVVK